MRQARIPARRAPRQRNRDRAAQLPYRRGRPGHPEQGGAFVGLAAARRGGARRARLMQVQASDGGRGADPSLGANRIRMETRITGSFMKNAKTFFATTLSLALAILASAVFAQAPKDAPPPPPPATTDQPATSVVVPGQAQSPRDTAGTEVIENPYGIAALWKQA